MLMPLLLRHAAAAAMPRRRLRHSPPPAGHTSHACHMLRRHAIFFDRRCHVTLPVAAMPLRHFAAAILRQRADTLPLR